MNLRFGLAAAMTLCAGAAHAQMQIVPMQPRPYVSAGVSYQHGDSADLTSLTGRLGVDVGRHLGVEAEGSVGVDGDTVVVGAVTSNVELQTQFGGFARLRMPLAPTAEAFVRGGYFVSNGEITTGGVTTDADEDDIALGAGLQFNFLQSGVRLEYTNYGLSDDGHSGAASYVMRF